MYLHCVQPAVPPNTGAPCGTVYCVVDECEVAIMRELASVAGHGAAMDGIRAALRCVDSVIATLRERGTVRLHGPEANAILRQCITPDHRVRRPSSHGHFGRYQWPWYLRRMPTVAFAGSFNKTAFYAPLLAEAVAFACSGVAVAHRRGANEGHFAVTGPLDRSP